MSTGVVKWFDTTKRYGFIQPDQGDKDIFVHMTELEKSQISSLREGQKVSYEVTTTNGKASAVNLQLV